MKLGIVDLSQIECRLLNYLAGQTDVVERFRTGEDPYIGIASQFYGRPITKEDKSERGAGKQAELMCGYVCGWKRFKAVARAGAYGPPVNLTDEEAMRFVNLYRQTHPAVVQLWEQGEWMLQALHDDATVQWGPTQIKNKKIYLPNGIPLHYILHQEDNEWKRRTRYGWTHIFGGKLVENWIQALARVVFSQALLRVWKRTQLRPVLISHDEGVYIIRHADELVPIVEEFKRPIAWLPDCPIDAEGVVAERYGK